MSDSLREQLIAAGFEAPKKKPENKSRKKKRSSAGSPNKKRNNPKGKDGSSSAKSSAKQEQADKEALERKKLKAQIKELIDNNKLDDWKGEVTYRYTVEKRIRELFVNEAAHKQLTATEVAITRLNGDTYLVPLAIANEIKKINPQWTVFNTDENTDTSVDEEYSKFQVPDDLQW